MQSRWLIGRRGLPRCENQSIFSPKGISTERGVLERGSFTRERELFSTLDRKERKR